MRRVSKTVAFSRSAGGTLAIAVAMLVAYAENVEAKRENVCSQTARTLFDACKASVVDDSLVNKAICINISSPDERRSCFDESRAARAESKQLCKDQRDWRRDTCTSLGEGRYDPDFSPALFDDPKNPSNPSPYFPLTVGNQWEYRGGVAVDTLEVVNETKLIAGVTCITVRDVVTKSGDLAENTDDWYAAAKDGNTWYFGEEAKDFESFDGDDPRRPELVSIDGSFKAGRNGDKPGIIFLASPAVGDVYVEEFSLGNAEDVTEILATTYRFGDVAELDQGVPQLLADHLCSAGDCVVTKNFSLLEPRIFARKYYARGIGVFLEVESEGDVIQLTSCNFDPKCVGLPPL